jgi:hypothetical protein
VVKKKGITFAVLFAEKKEKSIYVDIGLSK